MNYLNEGKSYYRCRYPNIDEDLILEKQSLEEYNEFLKIKVKELETEIEKVKLRKMKSKLKKHPKGFMYEDSNDGTGSIIVTYSEIKKYLKEQPVYLSGVDDNDEDWLIKFSKTLKKGNYFFKVDMFGENYILEKEELIDFIQLYYNPVIRRGDEKYISLCSQHLLKK